MRFVLAILLFMNLVFMPLGNRVEAQTPIVLAFSQPVEFVRADHSVSFCTHPANDEQSRTVGLMFQETMPERGGMFFDFQKADIVHMWMRNTVLPLDMVFIGADLRVVKIVQNTKPFSLAIISSDVAARYVLEINAGAAERHDVRVGDMVRLAATKCSLP